MLKEILWWLNNNASAMQALSGFLSFAVAIVTVPVLIRTMRVAREAAEAAKGQANAAFSQVEAAKEASRVSELQLAAAQESAAAEREHSALIRQQTLASLRPALIFVFRHGSPFGWTLLENQAEALALDIKAWNGTPMDQGKPIKLGQTVLGGRGETRVEEIDYGPYSQTPHGEVVYSKPAPAYATYRSQDGRSFITQVENLHDRLFAQSLQEEC